MMQQSFSTSVIRISAIIILLAATLCRAGWASQLSQHETAPLVDPNVAAKEHGHYHAPLLDHLHDDSSALSDDDHLFIHVVLALDHQVFLTTLPERSQGYSGGDYPPPISFNPLPPFQADLYRPPRHKIV